MRIGIDVDGVLIHTRQFMLQYGTKFFRRPPVNPDAYTIEEMYGISGAPVLLFGIRWFFPYYCRNYPSVPDAAAVYHKLKRGGHTIYQITARKFALSRSPVGLYSFSALKQWLAKNHFCYDRLLLCDEKHAADEKLRYCQQYRIDIMLEDNPATAEKLAQHGFRVLLFDAPYNRTSSAENLIRVKNWREAWKHLNAFQNQEKE